MNSTDHKFYFDFLNTNKTILIINDIKIYKKDILFYEPYLDEVGINQRQYICEEYQIKINDNYYLITYEYRQTSFGEHEELFYSDELKQFLINI